jgi:hypothetical protein
MPFVKKPTQQGAHNEAICWTFHTSCNPSASGIIEQKNRFFKTYFQEISDSERLPLTPPGKAVWPLNATVHPKKVYPG